MRLWEPRSEGRLYPQCQPAGQTGVASSDLPLVLMGRRNLDRYTAADWRAACPTVGSIRRAGWVVTAACPNCDLEIVADLSVVETIKGSEYSLWGATTRCRRRWCEGRMAFFVRPPGAQVEIRMVSGSS
jgi:hypothetical protein